MNENLTAKKGKSDLERAADAWMKYAGVLFEETYAREMAREFTEETLTEYARNVRNEAYARGVAKGLREALRILGWE
jgi:hypothetical protein